MKVYFYLLTALIMAAGVTGCKCSKKVTQQQQATKSLPEQRQIQPLEKRAVREVGADVGAASFAETDMTSTRSFALPSVIIYKTKADYSRNVPVGLNDEKTAIISYPGKTDIRGQEPMFLEYGFLLDRRGINPNVAFLKYTYDEYLRLDDIPPIAELFNLIIDTDPLKEMYHCGKTSDFRQGEVADQLNEMLKKSEGKPEEIFKRLK